MCGITGFIGKSKKTDVTYKIITSVFNNLETRGIDASGVWGSIDNKKSVCYHKDSIRSSVFTKSVFWQGLSNIEFDLMLLHCRAASKGVGKPDENINNHPFVNSTKNVAIVHNGRVPEFDYLKDIYPVNSECDSELFLSIFESKEDKLEAMNDIWSLVYQGHFAVAVGEKRDNDCRLWLFRNPFRPLWLVDMREYLGQIFFVSMPNIWMDSVSPLIKSKSKFIEVPPYSIFCFTYNKEIEYKSFQVELSDKFIDIELKSIEIKNNENELAILSPVKKTSIINDPIEDNCIQINDITEMIESVLNKDQLNKLNPYLVQVKSKMQEILNIIENNH